LGILLLASSPSLGHFDENSKKYVFCCFHNFPNISAPEKWHLSEPAIIPAAH